MAQSIKIMFTLAIYVSYGLQCYVPVEILLTRYFEKKIAASDHKLLYEYAIRIGVVIITFLSAVAIPRLGLFISLIGVFCLSALGLAFPAVIELCAKWPDNLGKFRCVLIKDLALVLFGIVALIVGTYVSVLGIVLSFM
uniref:Putative proton-coupled amino acid transporter 1 n=1 Tax=Xenopsylla cheopis TaxID=163159 RepID=A0A6M2DXR6_XENCH